MQAESLSQPEEHGAPELTQQTQDLTLAPSQTAAPASSKSIRFPLRHGRGTTGIKCVVKANHFFAELPDKDLHQYD
ncbi:hypothetical protein MKW94_029947, partial [Papaver nudicaule]|nr:hypothetical protein [Papaver nudicaule]